MKGSYLGPAFSDDEIEAFLDVRRRRLRAAARRGRADRAHGRGCSPHEKVVGWLQGRMEFGPRSLGGRSILGDPRSPKMQSVMNLKIKFRESFRPFAPSVLREHVGDYFDLDVDSPYMLLVAPVRDEHAHRDDRRAAAALRHREAERPALRHPGGHARRLLGAHPDGARRDEPALPRAARRAFTRSRAARCS